MLYRACWVITGRRDEPVRQLAMPEAKARWVIERWVKNAAERTTDNVSSIQEAVWVENIMAGQRVAVWNFTFWIEEAPYG